MKAKISAAVSLTLLAGLLVAMPADLHAQGKRGGKKSTVRKQSSQRNSASRRNTSRSNQRHNSQIRVRSQQLNSAVHRVSGVNVQRRVQTNNQSRSVVIRDHRNQQIVGSHRGTRVRVTRDHRNHRVRDHRSHPPSRLPPPRHNTWVPVPIDPGIGNGTPSCRPAPCQPRPWWCRPKCPPKPWCDTRPRHCWWWYDYCKPIQVCPPRQYVYCDWDYVICDYVAPCGRVYANSRWYLGIQGLVLPGKGLGIEQVDRGSPAHRAGLRPGQVIVRCNGVDLVNDQVMGTVIRQSNGILTMEVADEASGELAVIRVPMQRVYVVSH